MKVYKKDHCFRSIGYPRKNDLAGNVYAICDEENTHYLGCVYDYEVRIAKPAEFKILMRKDFTKWREIPLKEMAIICQTELINILGERFPYSESYWGTKEKFQVWVNPTTISEKIDRAVNDKDFFKKWRTTDEWAKIVSTYTIYKKKLHGKNICVIEGEGWFREEYSFNEYSITKATLTRIDEETAKKAIHIAAANKK